MPGEAVLAALGVTHGRRRRRDTGIMLILVVPSEAAIVTSREVVEAALVIMDIGVLGPAHPRHLTLREPAPAVQMRNGLAAPVPSRTRRRTAPIREVEPEAPRERERESVLDPRIVVILAVREAGIEAEGAPGPDRPDLLLGLYPHPGLGLPTAALPRRSDDDAHPVLLRPQGMGGEVTGDDTRRARARGAPAAPDRHRSHPTAVGVAV